MISSSMRSLQAVFLLPLFVCPVAFGQKHHEIQREGFAYGGLEPVPFKEIEDLGKNMPHLGGGSTKVQVEKTPPQAHTIMGVSNRPLVRPLEPLFVAAGQELPPALAELAKDYSLYVVTLDIHVIQAEGEKIKRIAFKATYPELEIATQQMFPATEWQSRFKVGFNGEVEISPTLDFIPKYL